MGQIGPHYKNLVYFQFDFEVKDYCWVSKIMENPFIENTIIENPQDELNQGLLYDRVTPIEVM